MVSDTPFVYIFAVSIKFPPKAKNRSRISWQPALSNLPNCKKDVQIKIKQYTIYQYDLKRDSIILQKNRLLDKYITQLKAAHHRNPKR